MQVSLHFEIFGSLLPNRMATVKIWVLKLEETIGYRLYTARMSHAEIGPTDHREDVPHRERKAGNGGRSFPSNIHPGKPIRSYPVRI